MASLTRRGWVAGDDLPPWKARILLRLALATGLGDAAATPAAVRRLTGDRQNPNASWISARLAYHSMNPGRMACDRP